MDQGNHCFITFQMQWWNWWTCKFIFNHKDRNRWSKFRSLNYRRNWKKWCYPILFQGKQVGFLYYFSFLIGTRLQRDFSPQHTNLVCMLLKQERSRNHHLSKEASGRMWEQVSGLGFGLVIKMPFGTPATQVWIQGFQCWSYFWF